MQQEVQSSSSESQGFYKPQINVIKEEEPPTPVKPSPAGNGQANQLFLYGRPTDYLPRMLTSFPSFIQLPKLCNTSTCSTVQTLLPLAGEKTKKCKYLSLQDKYQNNQLYELVYSKIETNEEEAEFSSYIFSLKQTTDYNPKDYREAKREEEGKESPFESRFQSGNLLLAYRCVESSIEEYDLILQNDTNTRGFNSWFFFSFKNSSSKSVKFNIINLIKRHSLFEEGVTPVGISQQTSQTKGWHPIGIDISYQKSYISRQILSSPPISKNYYTLSFTIPFQQTQDNTYLAMNYPYTYTKMINFIQGLESKSKDILIERQILCYSISNNALPVVKIRHREYVEGGRKIVVMARQHPGETVSSYTFQGFLRRIVNQEKLLRNYEIIAIPMVNPDGVIYGNFRTNLAGFDLNRQWLSPDRWLHPEIHAIKRLLSNLQNITFVLDFHSHSKKYNSFVFSCIGDPVYPFRVFPYIFSKNSDLFSIKDCTYNLTADKECTARIQIFKQINKPQIYTLETSFFGYEDQYNNKQRWNISHLFTLGESAAESLRIFLLKKKEVSAFEKEIRDKDYLFVQWSNQIKKDDLQSESNPSEDELTSIQRKEKVIEMKGVPKKRINPKSKKQIKKVTDQSMLNMNKIGHFVEEREKDRQRGRALMFISQEKGESKKNVAGPVIVQKKIESQRRKSAYENSKKLKKVDKTITMIEPQHSKLKSPRKRTTQVTTKQIMSSPPPSQEMIETIEKPSRSKLETVPPEPSQSHPQSQSVTSNLFSKPNFYNHFQKPRETKTPLYNKTQSLEITNKKDNFQDCTMDILRKLISSEHQDPNFIKVEPKRTKDKNYYYIRDKTVKSMNKMHEDSMKRNLEEEITNRTEALKNCQRKMNQIALTDPLASQLEPQPWEIPRFPQSTKQSKFPSIKLQKKHDYFLF